MANQEEIKNTIISVIDEVNETLSDDKKINRSVDTVLYGPEGHLDSLALTVFIVALEQRVENEFGMAVTLSGGMTLAPEKSFLKDISTLADYLHEVLKKKK